MSESQAQNPLEADGGCRLHLAPDFDEDAWIWEAKGCHSAMLEHAGRFYHVNFYDPVRLTQEAVDRIAREGLFLEENLVILERITRANMEAAARRIVASHNMGCLVPRQEAPAP